jgi:hypothetical protein
LGGDPGVGVPEVPFGGGVEVATQAAEDSVADVDRCEEGFGGEELRLGGLPAVGEAAFAMRAVR